MESSPDGLCLNPEEHTHGETPPFQPTAGPGKQHLKHQRSHKQHLYPMLVFRSITCPQNPVGVQNPDSQTRHPEQTLNTRLVQISHPMHLSLSNKVCTTPANLAIQVTPAAHHAYSNKQDTTQSFCAKRPKAPAAVHTSRCHPATITHNQAPGPGERRTFFSCPDPEEQSC